MATDASVVRWRATNFTSYHYLEIMNLPPNTPFLQRNEPPGWSVACSTPNEPVIPVEISHLYLVKLATGWVTELAWWPTS